ncbi:hypothetical protein CPB86DRAFT_792704 [Serendipita vermifera]|nr:hypothetical protein CPB86DRAFT_792704 [Serendipita vermifera]
MNPIRFITVLVATALVAVAAPLPNPNPGFGLPASTAAAEATTTEEAADTNGVLITYSPLGAWTIAVSHNPATLSLSSFQELTPPLPSLFPLLYVCLSRVQSLGSTPPSSILLSLFYLVSAV